MSNRFLLIVLAVAVPLSCSKYDDSALKAEIESHGQRLDTMQGQLGDIRSQLEALRDSDCVTAIEPIKDEETVVGFTVSFRKSQSVTILLNTGGSEGVVSLIIEGDKAVFTLSDGSKVEIPYVASPVVSLAKETVYVANNGYYDVAYTIQGGDSENKVEAVAGGYWKSEVIPSDAFSGKVRIYAPGSGSPAGLMLMVTDAAGHSSYASLRLAPMSTEVSADNRYSMTIYKQEDGSWALGALQYAVLEGAEPEGLYEPFDAPPLVGSSSVADVEYDEIVYKSYADRDLHMNICKAVGATEPVPVVFFTHGGGWRAGDHNSLLKVARYMAKYSGFAGVSVQYSLAGQTDTYIETSVQDLRDALTWLGTHAEEYNLDMSRVAFVGNSAGGHLSALMAMTWPSAKVLVGWAGVYDLMQHIKDGGAAVNSQQKYFHKGDADALTPYSPILLIPDASDRQVACMLLHGTADNQVFFKQAPLFSAALSSAGQKVQEEFYPYYSHGLVGSSDKNAECLAKTLNFIKENL